MRILAACSVVMIAFCFAASARQILLPPVTPSGNPSNDKLLAMPENEQAAMLSKATHYGCIGKEPYYMGTQTLGANKGVSFWSISCQGSSAQFMIAIAPDAIGSTRVFSCNLLNGRPWECYEKIKPGR